MSYDDIKKTRSSDLARFFGVTLPDLNAHDALDDAISVAHALRYLLERGKLIAADFD